MFWFLLIEPMPPKICCNCNNKNKSGICKLILNLDSRRHPVLYLLFLVIDVINKPSPSIKSVQNQELILGWKFKEKNFLYNWLEGILIR